MKLPLSANMFATSLTILYFSQPELNVGSCKVECEVNKNLKKWKLTESAYTNIEGFQQQVQIT